MDLTEPSMHNFHAALLLETMRFCGIDIREAAHRLTADPDGVKLPGTKHEMSDVEYSMRETEDWDERLTVLTALYGVPGEHAKGVRDRLIQQELLQYFAHPANRVTTSAHELVPLIEACIATCNSIADVEKWMKTPQTLTGLQPRVATVAGDSIEDVCRNRYFERKAMYN